MSADVSGGDKCIYSLQRLLSAAVLRLSMEKTIHPHTCICNEIISLPPRAAISQPPVPGRARSHTRGWDAEEKELGEVRNRYSRAAGQTGKYTVPERAEDEKRSPKGNKRCRESRRNKTEPQKHIVYGDEQRVSTTSPKFINVVE